MEKIWARRRQQPCHKTVLNYLGHQWPVAVKGLNHILNSLLKSFEINKKFDEKPIITHILHNLIWLETLQITGSYA